MYVWGLTMIKNSIFIFLFLFLISGAVSACCTAVTRAPIEPYVIVARKELFFDKAVLRELQLKNLILYEEIVAIFNSLVITTNSQDFLLFQRAYDCAVKKYEKFGDSLTKEQYFGFQKHFVKLPTDFLFPSNIPDSLSLYQELFLLNKLVEKFKELNDIDLRSFHVVSSQEGTYAWFKKRYLLFFCCVCYGAFYLKNSVVGL